MTFIITYILIGIIAWLIVNVLGLIAMFITHAGVDGMKTWQLVLAMSISIVVWAALWPLTTVNYALYLIKFVRDLI